MAKGSIAKQEITNKILEIFPGSFIYEKEIRIPIQENGELVQIKCSLTCAKTNVEQNDDIAIPGENAVTADINFNNDVAIDMSKKVIEPTQEEKDNVKKLMEKLGL